MIIRTEMDAMIAANVIKEEVVANQSSMLVGGYTLAVDGNDFIVTDDYGETQRYTSMQFAMLYIYPNRRAFGCTA